MGSKSKIAKYIVPIIQKYIDDGGYQRYYEPFVGGGNIIDKVRAPYRYGSDLNPYLIALLKHVQSGGQMYDTVSKELYDEARSAFNKGDTSGFEDWQIGNIGFIASYNGRWFDGGYAKSNYSKTKNGTKMRDYYREAYNNLMNQVPLLGGIVFECCDYRDIDTHGSVVYCDPPYCSTKQYAYSKSFDYDEFWNKMRKWSRDNVVLVSEQSAPDDWEAIWEMPIIRTIDAKNKNIATERLFKIRE